MSIHKRLFFFFLKGHISLSIIVILFWWPLTSRSYSVTPIKPDGKGGVVKDERNLV